MKGQKRTKADKSGQLYLESGYPNIDWIISEFVEKRKIHFVFNVGQRGCGKTYGFIDWLIRNNKKWIYMRRLQNECDFQNNPTTSSLIPNLLDMGIEFEVRSESQGKLKRWWNVQEDKEICLCMALKTFSNFKGMNFKDYDYILFDEFIKEPHQAKIKAEGNAFQSVIETINRNRELTGGESITAVCCGNSVDIANDLFLTLGLVPMAEKLADEEGKEIEYIDGRLVMIFNKYSPIAKRKERTALYQLASEEYKDLALKNKFVMNDMSYVKKMKNLREYRCLFQVGHLWVYEHKSNHEYYIGAIPSNVKEIFKNSYTDLERFRRTKIRLWWKYMDGRIRFDSYNSIALWEKYFEKN